MTTEAQKLDIFSGTVRKDSDGIFKTFYFGNDRSAKSVYIDFNLQIKINNWYKLRNKHKLSVDVYYVLEDKLLYVYYLSSITKKLKHFQIDDKKLVIYKTTAKYYAMLI